MMTVREEAILEKISKEVEQIFSNEPSGHDWWHLVRVTNLARQLAREEEADSFLCQLASLVHDLIDDKLPFSTLMGEEGVRRLLLSNGVTEEESQMVLDIISTMSFKAGTGLKPTSLEGQVVQDADRLNAMGAIGIARTMAYSGHTGRLIHNPNLAARTKLTLEDYRSSQGTAIMHFDEKLLKLKDLMNTVSAKRIAEERHAFLELYLKVFLAEWEGKR